VEGERRDAGRVLDADEPDVLRAGTAGGFTTCHFVSFQCMARGLVLLGSVRSSPTAQTLAAVPTATLSNVALVFTGCTATFQAFPSHRIANGRWSAKS
jgi:hypothetical protein